MTYSRPSYLKTLPKDIEAEITFLRTDENGRSSAAFSNFRPPFCYDGECWVAILAFPDVERVLPGDTVRAYATFLRPECHVGKLFPGKAFQLWEGKIIANGKVTRIIDLESSARRVIECTSRQQS